LGRVTGVFSRRLGGGAMNGFSFDSRETVLVIGVGKSGLACTEVLRARGATVYATDEKPREAIAEAVGAVEAAGARFVVPEQLPSIVAELSVTVLSPGVPLTSPVVQEVQRVGVAVLGEIEVAFRLCKAPIIAVTGTKGKSTTTALIGHFLRSCGRSVRVGGNIGDPLIGEVFSADADEWVVAEVSSFQLETIHSFKPRVAVLLNIEADHLDRYSSIEEYAEAKFRIVAHQAKDDAFIGNLDDERIAAFGEADERTRVRAQQYWFTLRGPEPRAAMYVHEGAIFLGAGAKNARSERIVRCDQLPLIGRHNVQNVMAALLAALAVGCDVDALRAAAKSFVPMHHRLAPLLERNGILYVDDSKATNPSAVIAALRSFERPIVLIAGGRAKGTNFHDLGTAIAQRAKALVTIGEAGDAIARDAGNIRHARAASMPEAVSAARSFAVAGDVILLSPGCASFDMFRSAEDRGECFASAVRESLGDPLKRGGGA
jgi:UDP-N-acetylmuramoylalanine--D-glutamate ligase